MLFQEWLGEKILAAGMAGARDEAHIRRHVAVGGFALDGAAGSIGIVVPLLDSAWGNVDMTAQGTFVALGLFRRRITFERIHVIGKEALGLGFGY